MIRRLLGICLIGLLLPACTGGGAGTLTPTVAPGIPSNVQAFPGNHSVKITWSTPDAGAQFIVERSIDAGGPFFPVSVPSQFTDPTTYVDSGLATGTSYFYVVQTTNSFGTSSPTSVVSATPGFKPVQISCSRGDDCFLALLPDSSVWGWGFNTPFQTNDVPVQVPTRGSFVAVSAGDSHFLLLGTDGRVWAWGDNSFGQLGNGSAERAFAQVPALVNGLMNIIQISTGGDFNVALDHDGIVWVWGDNTSGELAQPESAPPLVAPGPFDVSMSATPLPVSGLPPIVAVSAGSSHVLALAQDGLVWSWGANQEGQLGNGTTSSSPTPTPAVIGNLTKITQISAGVRHNLAVRTDGTVWVWGDNSIDELGIGTVPGPVTAPVQAIALSRIVAVAAGSQHSVALRDDGAVWTWGDNQWGQLGNPSVSLTATGAPAPVPGLPLIAAVAASNSNTIALGSDGTVWVWGENNQGQLGNGTGEFALPAVVNNLNGVTSINAGNESSSALRSNGTVWMWGTNGYAELGNGTVFPATTPAPTQAPPTGIAVLGRGSGCPVCITETGNVWAWGADFEGQVGNGSTASLTAAPTQVLTGATLVSTGDIHTLALRSDGTVWSWGGNVSLQLGYGPMNTGYGPLGTAVPTPTQVPGLAGASAVSAGGSHSVALLPGGTVWTWGDNTYGQLGYSTAATSSATPTQVSGIPTSQAVAGGGSHTLALATDGTVWAWGENFQQGLGTGSAAAQSSVPAPVTGLSSVIAISAGYRYSLALKSDGTVWAWGDNEFEQLGNNQVSSSPVPLQVTALPRITVISAGTVHSLALAQDGTVWAWGFNESGELGVPFVLYSAVPVLISP